MKFRLGVHDVAVKQLESAIFMYAHNFDEVAVHTISGAAWELYSKRLNLSTFQNDIQKLIKPERQKEFMSLWNQPYDFFKHGEHRYKKLDFIEYDEKSVEILLYLASEANLLGPEEYRLKCADIYRLYFYFRWPELFDEKYYERHFIKPVLDLDLTVEMVKEKSALRIWLNSIGHVFLDGTNSPFREVDKQD